MGVMQHLADFLRMLSVSCRVSYLPLLHEIIHSTNPFNWRLRQCLAVQVPDLLLLPPPELVFNTLYLLIITLLQDPVASVRRDSFTGVAKMMMVLSDHGDALSTIACINSMNLNTRVSVAISNGNLEGSNDARNMERSNRWTAQHLAASAVHHVDTVARAINSLIQSKTYQQRQLWVELSHALLLELPQSLFEKYFLNGLLYLTSDPVSNVRVAVGLVLSGWGPGQEPILENMNDSLPSSTSSTSTSGKGGPWTWLLRRSDVKECVQRLSCDDNDVYSSIIKLKYCYPDLHVRVVSCRGLKEAPGGSVPVLNTVTGAYTSENFISDIDEDKYSDIDTPYINSDEAEESLRRVRKKNVEVHQYITENMGNEAQFIQPERVRSLSVGSPGDKERNVTFGVKSPGRGAGVLATAIAGLMQQQEEEIEQERLMHLGEGEIDSSLGLGSLDALMRVEDERKLQETRPRGMSLPGQIIYDDIQDEDDEDDLSPTGQTVCRPISPLGTDSTTKYMEQDEYEDDDEDEELTSSLPPSSHSSSSSSLSLHKPTALHSFSNGTSFAHISELVEIEADATVTDIDLEFRVDDSSISGILPEVPVPVPDTVTSTTSST